LPDKHVVVADFHLSAHASVLLRAETLTTAPAVGVRRPDEIVLLPLLVAALEHLKERAVLVASLPDNPSERIGFSSGGAERSVSRTCHES
jgi:hypothetical protein